MKLTHWLRPLAARLIHNRPCPANHRPRFRPQVEGLEDRSVPATFIVTNVGDNGGVNPAAFAGTGTLRQALVDSTTSAEADTIQFALPDALKSPGGWWTIQRNAAKNRCQKGQEFSPSVIFRSFRTRSLVCVETLRSFRRGLSLSRLSVPLIRCVMQLGFVRTPLSFISIAANSELISITSSEYPKNSGRD